MKPRALVAQSGGPSPVINASLQGVLDACRDYPDQIGELYAGWHGIEGVLQEQLLDLSAQAPEELRLLRTTPAAGAIGTCRYKLREQQTQDFDRILEVIQAHGIGYFFYIGRNDSMDTANKVAALAERRGYELTVVGVPKTIDNDVGDPEFRLIDHTPGYGSAARYWASIIQNVDEENRGISVSEPVSVLQAMGRKAGFIPAASRLADPQREMPLQLYLAEIGHSLEVLAENVNRQLRQSGRCIVVVSEGFDAGSVGEAYDGFGHIEYGASRTTVAQLVTNYLNDHGLKVRGQATYQVPGVLQRCTSAFASTIDIDEAYEVGRKAVQIAVYDGGGWMATILRQPGEAYAARYEKVPLGEVANSFRQLPSKWITPDGLDVTEDFIRYAKPLIGDRWPEIPVEGGLQRFARLEPSFVPTQLAKYVPQNWR